MFWRLIKLCLFFSVMSCMANAQTVLEVPFYRGAIGESVTNTTAPLNLSTFSTLGIDSATISQTILNGGTDFGDVPQGNDYNVKLTFQYGNGNPSQTIDAVVNFRDGNTEAIGLITEPDSGGVYPDDGSGYTVTTGNRPVYLLQLATSTGSYQEGGVPLVNSNDSNTQALKALNDYKDQIEAGLDPQTGATGGGSTGGGSTGGGSTGGGSAQGLSCGNASNAGILQCNPVDNSLGQTSYSIDSFRNRISPTITTQTQDGNKPDSIPLSTNAGLFERNNFANTISDSALDIDGSQPLNSHQWNSGIISSAIGSITNKHIYNRDNPGSDILVGNNILNTSTHGNHVDAVSDASGVSSQNRNVSFLQENFGEVINNSSGAQFRLSTVDGTGSGASDNINQVETIALRGNSSITRARGNYVSYTLNAVE